MEKAQDLINQMGWELWADLSIDNLFERNQSNAKQADLKPGTKHCSKCGGYGVLWLGKSRLQCTQCKSSSGLELV